MKIVLTNKSENAIIITTQRKRRKKYKKGRKSGKKSWKEEFSKGLEFLNKGAGCFQVRLSFPD